MVVVFGSLGPSNVMTSTCGGVIVEAGLFPFLTRDLGGDNIFVSSVDDWLAVGNAGETAARVGPDGEDIGIVEGAVVMATVAAWLDTVTVDNAAGSWSGPEKADKFGTDDMSIINRQGPH